MENIYNYETLKVESISHKNNNIFQVTLNREQALNSLNLTMLNELSNLFDKIKKDNSIKTVLITGVGKSFCAGADITQLKMLDKETGYSFATSGQEIFNKIENLGKPVLAAINGYCFGGGLELAMACTIRIASDKALFGQPEIKLGIIPGYGGTQRLSRLIGKGRTIDVCLTGDNIKPEDALNWGLITKITDNQELLNISYDALIKLNKMPRLAMQSIITTINEGFNLYMDEALELEAEHFAKLCSKEDKNIGVDAFLSKQKPEFKD